MKKQSFDEMAAAMDLRMKQLAAQGVAKAVVVERMIGFVPQLQHICAKASKRQLARLFDRYPRFHTFASLCEDVAEAITQQRPRPSEDPLALPEPLLQSFTDLVATAAALETGYQACLDAEDWGSLAQPLCALSEKHSAWLLDLERVLSDLMRHGIPHGAMQYIGRTMEDTRHRITSLKARVAEQAPCGTPAEGSISDAPHNPPSPGDGRDQ